MMKIFAESEEDKRYKRNLASHRSPGCHQN